jgi:hypothetical protein
VQIPTGKPAGLRLEGGPGVQVGRGSSHASGCDSESRSAGSELEDRQLGDGDMNSVIQHMAPGATSPQRDAACASGSRSGEDSNAGHTDLTV